MNEGGVKAWETHQVQNPLAFSDEEEEDLLDFMYKYKAPRKTEFPLEVHDVWGHGLEHVFPQGLCTGDLGVLGLAALGTSSISQGPGVGRPLSIKQQDRPLDSIQIPAKRQKRTLLVLFRNKRGDIVPKIKMKNVQPLT